MDSSSLNCSAFLAALRVGEGTAIPDGYRVCYGGSLFHSFDDHPALTGEFHGVVLPDRYCDAAGVPRGSRSTAAGAYQINLPTWKPLKVRLALPDFSPASQDAAAEELLRELGALSLISGGLIQAALTRACRRWASLPGSPADQPQRSLADFLQDYQRAGGKIAVKY